MISAIVLVTIFIALVRSSGEGNIKLLEDDVAVALKACYKPDDNEGSRQRRSKDYGYVNRYDVSLRIDGNHEESNLYSHERRNSSDKEQLHVLNATDYDYGGYGSGNTGEKFVNSVSGPAGTYNSTNTTRTKRSEPLLKTSEFNQCLSQCVFANLQMVDARGIPREGELWNKFQSSVTSQQSRAALKDQVRACFQELQSEAEDNGCSYSNKLERCLMLRFADRVDRKTNNSSKT